MVTSFCSVPGGLGLPTCVEPSRRARADSVSSKILVELVNPKNPGLGLDEVKLGGRGGRTGFVAGPELAPVAA